MSKYTPTPEQLKPRASLFWPDELRAKEEAISVIPKLIRTQEKFISILDVSDGSTNSWINVLGQMKDFPANLFLKHLMVLADVGGELLKRLSPELPAIFPDRKMVFVWNGKNHIYEFKAIASGAKIGNDKLFVDGESLATAHELDDKMEDVIMLLLFGSAVTNATLPPLIGEKCMIGSLIGESDALKRFVKERYIFVSRITAWATSNTLGQMFPTLAWVKRQLRNNLVCPLRTKILKAFVVGSVAKGCSRPNSDLDIAVVIPPKRRISAIKFSENFHLKFGLRGACYPNFNNQRVDFQFFYPFDTCLAQYAKCELV